MDPDPGGPKTCASGGSRFGSSATLVKCVLLNYSRTDLRVLLMCSVYVNRLLLKYSVKVLVLGRA
jgi:hypothetical protein